MSYDFSDTIIGLYMLCIVFSFIAECDQPILTALAGAVIASSSISLVFMMLMQIGTEWNEEIATVYALLLSLLVVGLGMNFLVAAERNRVRK